MEERGCEAAGYGLAGAPVQHVCCRHLYGSDRMLTVWPAEHRTIVLLVGPHSGRAGDVYLELLDALGVDVPAGEREKPSCCDDSGVPPVEEAVAEAIADAVERSARRARRR